MNQLTLLFVKIGFFERGHGDEGFQLISRGQAAGRRIAKHPAHDGDGIYGEWGFEELFAFCQTRRRSERLSFSI